MATFADRVTELRETLETFAQMADTEAKGRRIQELEGRMACPGFWEEQEQAQRVIGELKRLKNIVDPYQEILDTLDACAELAQDSEALEELEQDLTAIEQQYAKLELSLALAGEYDSHNIYLSIQAGAGGTDARDWAEMLLRMYSAYAQRAGYRCEIMDIEEGKDAGIQSCTLSIQGPMAYGYFKSEMGTHRLVRISPFNSGGTRETSFAAVEVTPELPDAVLIKLDALDDKEFRIDTYRSSGAGGQHINKTDSAVRITHLPTGLVTSCQTERSQIQNRDKAWKLMAAKLQQLKDAERLEELQALQGERGTIGWGHQIRSYVLHPYQMVKDLRSGYEVSNVDGILNGDLRGFIDAYLRWRLGSLLEHGSSAG